MPSLLLAALVAGGCPCLYDRDIAAERAAAPGAFEAIFGFYPVRTRECWEHRLTQVAAEAEAAGGLTPALYDDRAVAEARLGRREAAVALLREKEERYPGQFTTQANLGWVLFELGRYGAAGEALERAAALGGDEQKQQLEWQRRLVTQRDEAERDPRRAAERGILGGDLAAQLGDGFRLHAPPPETEPAPLLERLGLPADVVAILAGLIVLAPEQSEPYFALAELLAAKGERKLAWHAYQRAYDLEHPRSVDILLFQDQVRSGATRDSQGEMSTLAHVRLRRRAIAWQRAWQAFERERLAAGEDPLAPAALERFRAEHPLP